MSIKGIAVGLVIIALIASAAWYYAGGSISIPTSTSATETPAATTSDTPSPVAP